MRSRSRYGRRSQNSGSTSGAAGQEEGRGGDVRRAVVELTVGDRWIETRTSSMPSASAAVPEIVARGRRIDRGQDRRRGRRRRGSTQRRPRPPAVKGRLVDVAIQILPEGRRQIRARSTPPAPAPRSEAIEIVAPDHRRGARAAVGLARHVDGVDGLIAIACARSLSPAVECQLRSKWMLPRRSILSSARSVRRSHSAVSGDVRRTRQNRAAFAWSKSARSTTVNGPDRTVAPPLPRRREPGRLGRRRWPGSTSPTTHRPPV